MRGQREISNGASKKLGRKFYTRDTLTVAKEMLGKYLVHVLPRTESPLRSLAPKWGKDIKLVGKIVETEAYIGPEDKASHAFGGKVTTRNIAEFMAGGHIYIYLVYGMYWQFNISTGKEGSPECVLIRAIEPIEGEETMMRLRQRACGRRRRRLCALTRDNLINGPGKLCEAMKLDRKLYGVDMAKSKKIWLEDKRGKISPSLISASPRIGIDYAGPEWSGKLWRFYIKGNKYVSKY